MRKATTLAILTTLTAALVACTDSKDAAVAPPTAMGTPMTASICDPENAVQPNIKGISKDDGAAICRTMQASLGRPPSPKLLATMEKMTFGLLAYGYKGAAKELSYQVMNIIEARKQLDAGDEVMIGTMNVITKCFTGSDGHVTPRELNINLRASGPMAETMSDDGIYGLAAIIQEEKKNRGE